MSKTTAANVLSGRKKASPETTRRVLAAAKSLDYRLDSAASSLSRGRTPVIGVMVAEFVPGMVVSGISAVFVQRCSEAGLVVSFASQAKAQALLDSGIDMLVVLGSADRNFLDSLKMPFGLPVVAMETVDGRPFSWAHHDPVAIARTVMGHLGDQGCRHVGWLLGPGVDAVFEPWTLALDEVAGDMGLAFTTVRHDGTPDGVTHAMGELLAAGVEGVFSAMAPTPMVYDALRALGKSAPVDVLLVVQADGVVEDAMTPKISTLSLMSLLSGVVIADLCIATVAGRPVEPVQLPFELSVRESSTRP